MKVTKPTYLFTYINLPLAGFISAHCTTAQPCPDFSKALNGFLPSEINQVRSIRICSLLVVVVAALKVAKTMSEVPEEHGLIWSGWDAFALDFARDAGVNEDSDAPVKKVFQASVTTVKMVCKNFGSIKIPRFRSKHKRT